ncbi:hypothetical protein EDB84DRAFT_1573278 [Lactarius hengduanensis]|nr:hypothetical protein EDB84DRAFT_1573278 [Lactarius hengduanensis]
MSAKGRTPPALTRRPRPPSLPLAPRAGQAAPSRGARSRGKGEHEAKPTRLLRVAQRAGAVQCRPRSPRHIGVNILKNNEIYVDD